MPQRPRTVCREPGCKALTSGTYCAEHLLENKEIEQHREYDRRRREDPYRAIYKTARWERLRERILRRDPLCQIATLCGGTAPSTVVDHVIPVRQRPDLAWDEQNLQGACKRDHDRKTATEDSNWAGWNRAAK